MKKFITVLLIFIFMFASVFPINVFASTDSELEKALTVVKERITIPDEYQDFTYSMSTDAARKVWSFSWRNKNDKYSGSINVRIDDKGTIENYSFYDYSSYPSNQKLPKFSRDNAKAAAVAFLERVNPGFAMMPISNSFYEADSIYGTTYRFTFARSINGIPFYSNSCSVEVNRNTNEIEQFYMNWQYDLQFPDAGQAITMLQARSAFIQKIGLKLTYNYYFDENENIKFYTAYLPKFNNAYSIDAITGEKTLTQRNYWPLADKSMENASTGKSEVKNIVLTPEEINAIEKNSKLLSQVEAEAAARSFKPSELTADFALRYSSLEKSYLQKGEYLWSLNFTNESETVKDNYRYVSITLNAATGEVQSFYTYYPTAAKEAIYDKAASKAIVENFLKENYPTKFNNTVLDESADLFTIPVKESQSYYSFKYVRLVNGTEFTNNYIEAGFDAITGKIVRLSVNWFGADSEFPSTKGVIPVQKAYEILFDKIGMVLNYTLKYNSEIYMKYPADMSGKEVKLVYSIDNTKPAIIDAKTGMLLNTDGKPFKENKPIQYADITGHFAEKQITILGQFGIALDGNEFAPDNSIIQKDYLYLLMKGINGYWSQYPSEDKDIDAMYADLTRAGMVKEGEKAPESVINREDAVKFMIRALKYDKVADIKDIFTCSFMDAEAISSDLIGYVAIASGLKIIQGYDGYFSPKDSLTRAQAMVMIYNYLAN